MVEAARRSVRRHRARQRPPSGEDVRARRPAADAPKEVVYLILGSLQFSEAALRVYGHPELLAVAAAINGPDFVPFNEALFIKEPGRGASVAWHQDGMTHWDSPDWDQGIHGFNFMAQLYGCTAANGVWVVPGSHKLGKVDIKALVAEAGSERLPDAVPIICAPGDVAITNRQALHGSFANTSKDWRVTINFGFHRRKSVLGVQGGGVHNAVAVYDAERIRERARLIGYGIDARRQRFPDETPYVYKPHAEAGLSLPLGREGQRPGSRTTTFSTSASERTKNTDDVLTQPVNRVVISHAWSGDAARDEELSMTGRKV